MSHVRPARGMILLLAAAFVAVLTTIVLLLGDLALVHRSAAHAERSASNAQQVAEMGLARAVADMNHVAALGEQDLDRLLDPDLDGDDGNGERLYLPPSAALPLASDTWGGWGSGELVLGGAGHRYRRVQVDANADGRMDAYLVRWDDNHDDSLPGLPSTTGNNGRAEGGGVDEPMRDRDQGVVITAVGLNGGITPALANARYTLRATVQSAGGASMLVGNNYDTLHNNELCGDGAVICSSLPDDLDCWCGAITYNADLYPTEASLPGWAQTGPFRAPACPTTGGADRCGSCGPQRLVPVSASMCEQMTPSPPAPPAITAYDAAFMDNFRAGACHFYLGRGHFGFPGAHRVVFMWDRSADDACAPSNFPDGTPFPDPDINPIGLSFPADCWVPVFASNDAVDRDGSNNWVPGLSSAAGTVVALDAAVRPARAGSIVTGTVTYPGACGCPGCISTNTSPIFGTAGEIITQSNAPRGYYFVPEQTDVLNGGGATVKPMAVVGWGDVRILDVDTLLQPPSPHRFAVVGRGEVTVGVARSGFGGAGIRSGADIHLSVPNNHSVRGSLVATGSITHSGNNGGLCGSGGTMLSDQACPRPPPQCHAPTACAAATLATWQAGSDITLPDNNMCICANLRATDDVRILGDSNNGTIGGSIWAGDNFDTNNNLNINPSAGASLIGARPRVVMVQGGPY